MSTILLDMYADLGDLSQTFWTKLNHLFFFHEQEWQCSAHSVPFTVHGPIVRNVCVHSKDGYLHTNQEKPPEMNPEAVWVTLHFVKFTINSKYHSY